MTLSQIHSVLAQSMILYSLAYGLWGLYNYVRKVGPSGSYWGTLMVAELLYIAQGVAGAVLYLQGLRPARGVHLLYGVLALITVPAAYAYLRGQDDRRVSLVFGLVGLFLAGVALRAIGTAGP